MTDGVTTTQFKALQERVKKEEDRRAFGDTSVSNLVVAEEGRRAALEAEMKVRLSAIEAKIGRPEEPPKVEPPPTPPPVANPDIFLGDQISDFPGKQFVPGGVTEVADPLGSGQKVLKFTVNDSDEPIKSGNPRAQLESPDFVTPGLEFWFRTKLLIPSDFPSFNGWMTLFSVYGAPYAGSGPWHLSSSDGRNIEWEEHSWSTPITRGKWVDIMQHGVFSENGWLEIYLNGQLSMPKTTAALRNSTNNGGPNNVRIAQYRKKGMIPGQATLYWGPLLCGSTKASVGG